MSQDIDNTLDLSGQTSISGADINQIVATAIPADERGMTVHTVDVAGVPVVPDAATDTKLKRYVWIRQGAATVTAYVWDDVATSDATYLKWQSITTIGIADGSITNAKLAALAVTADKIALGTITSAQIAAGVIPSSLPPSGAAGGSLDGTYPNPSIAAAAVDSNELANNAVITNKISNQNVTKEKVELLGIRKVMRGSVNGSANELVDLYIQRLVQTYDTYTSIDGAVAANLIPVDNSIPQNATEGNNIFTGLTFTPQKIGSKVFVRVQYWIGVSAVTTVAVATIWKDADAGALSATIQAFTASFFGLIEVTYSFTTASLTPIDIKSNLGVGSTTATAILYINGSSANRLFGGVSKAIMEVVEVPA